MKKIIMLLSFIAMTDTISLYACDKCYIYDSEDLEIISTKAVYRAELKELVLSVRVKGTAGATTPDSTGKLQGAGVLSYLFLTTLKPEDIGFGQTDGIVALALTSHPDFDYSPLWDENNNGNYTDDGRSWQSHWVILVKEARVGGGYAVKELEKDDKTIKMPTTSAFNVPVYMDSPGFQVVIKNNTMKVIVPSYRINNKIDFNFNAISCYMTFNTSDPNLPMLGIRNIYYTASKNMTFPYTVK
jgi:hypothetical protein